LSPTIKSIEAANQGLNITLLDRMAQRYPDITKMLEIQYRMNEKIMM
jgi:superfamily I DNA and/or RNA helicase